MNFRLSVIILAAGKSLRFEYKTKKQFCVINRLSILEYSVRTFYNFDFVDEIIIVLPKEDLLKYKRKFVKYSKIKVVSGGKERYNSVQNGLKECSLKTEYIAIHDAARPLVSAKIILDCMKEIKNYDCVIPGLKISDTLKEINSNFEVERHIDRTRVVAVQTPQVFRAEVVKKIYSEENIEKWTKKYNITDDSQLAQLEGYKIKVVEGEKKNLKITSKEDLELVKFFLKKV